MKKRILSIVLCLVMVFSLLPFTASAASAIPINEETFPDPVFREYVLKIVGSSVLTEEKARLQCPPYSDHRGQPGPGRG